MGAFYIPLTQLVLTQEDLLVENLRSGAVTRFRISHALSKVCLWQTRVGCSRSAIRVNLKIGALRYYLAIKDYSGYTLPIRTVIVLRPRCSLDSHMKKFSS